MLFDFSYFVFQVLRRKFWGIFRPLAANANTTFSTFCLFMFIATFQSLVKFVVWSFLFCISFFLSHFSLKIAIFSWVVEFLENILALPLKQDLLYSQQSVAKEKLLYPWSRREGSYKIQFFCPSFHLPISFLGIFSLVFSET